MEIFKDIKGYEGCYQVSDFGNVRSLKWGKIKRLKSHIDKRGYYFATLCYKGKVKTFYIHQLIAITFLNHIPNGHKIVVDHIDNNKSNNHISNIQLVTHRYNSSKDVKNTSSNYTGVSWHKIMKKWISYIVINKKLKFLGYFSNEEEASEAYKKALKTIIKQNKP